MAATLASLHVRTADDLFGTPQGSPRTDKLIAASVQWARLIMDKIDRVCEEDQKQSGDHNHRHVSQWVQCFLQFFLSICVPSLAAARSPICSGRSHLLSSVVSRSNNRPPSLRHNSEMNPKKWGLTSSGRTQFLSGTIVRVECRQSTTLTKNLISPCTIFLGKFTVL